MPNTMSNDELIPWSKLKPDFIRQLAAQGRKVPAEYADTTKARLYYAGDAEVSMYVQHCGMQELAYAVWQSLPKGVLCAFRGANDLTPVYSHDLVDRL